MSSNVLEDVDLTLLLAEREEIMRQLEASNDAINNKREGKMDTTISSLPTAPPPLPPSQPNADVPKPPADNPKSKRKSAVDQSQQPLKVARNSHLSTDNQLDPTSSNHLCTPLQISVAEVRRSVKNPMLLTASHLLSPDENISQCESFTSSPVLTFKTAPSAGPFEHSSYDDLNISVDSDGIFGMSDGANRPASSGDLDFSTELLTPDSYEKDESTLRSVAILHEPSYKPDGYESAHYGHQPNFHTNDIMFGADLLQGRNFESVAKTQVNTPSSPQPVKSDSPTPVSSRSLSPSQFQSKGITEETDSDPSSSRTECRPLVMADETDESALNDLQSAALKILSSSEKTDESDEPMEMGVERIFQSAVDSLRNGAIANGADEDETSATGLDEERMALTALGVLPEDFDATDLNEEDIDALLERPMKDYDTEKSKWSGLKVRLRHH